MKKVFTAPSLIPCDLLRSLLKDAGIPCVLKNEGGSAMTGNSLPLPYASELGRVDVRVYCGRLLESSVVAHDSGVPSDSA